MTLDDIHAIATRAEKATSEAPWYVWSEDKHEQVQVLGGPGNRLVAVCAHECVSGLVPEMHANAKFIAAARTDVSRLCKALELALEALAIAEEGLRYSSHSSALKIADAIERISKL